MSRGRRTIDSSDNTAVLGGMKAKNNGRYNGNGRHWSTPPRGVRPAEPRVRVHAGPVLHARDGEVRQVLHRGRQRACAVMGGRARVHEPAVWVRGVRLDGEGGSRSHGAESSGVGGWAAAGVHRPRMVASGRAGACLRGEGLSRARAVPDGWTLQGVGVLRVGGDRLAGGRGRCFACYDAGFGRRCGDREAVAQGRRS